jgi:DNA-binding response OmpR family regulator
MEHVDGTGSHVLVMDDDQATCDLYQEVLEDEGYQVTLASSPKVDVAAIAALAPDLILLDLHFPRATDGLAVLARLKAEPGTVAIPVLVCSADHRLLEAWHDRLLAWDCGALAKPFGLDDLLAAIAACLAPAFVAAGEARMGPLAAYGRA